MESSVILVKVDAVGFGVLHFSLVGFFGAGPYFTLVVRRIKRGAVFASGVGLVIDALDFVAAPADEGVALFAECGAAAVAELSRSHF
jgi:hypothetical protein